MHADGRMRRLAANDAVSTGRIGRGRRSTPSRSSSRPAIAGRCWRRRWRARSGRRASTLEVVIVDDGSATAAPVARAVRRPARANRPPSIVRSASPAPATAASRRRAGSGSRSSTTTTSGRPRSCGASSTRLPPRRGSFAYAGVILVTADRGAGHDRRPAGARSPAAAPRRPTTRSPPGASNVVVATDLAARGRRLRPELRAPRRLGPLGPSCRCRPRRRLRRAPRRLPPPPTEHALDGRWRLRRAGPIRPHARAPGPPSPGANLVLPLARRRPAPRRADARAGGDEPPRCPALPQPRRRDPGGPDPAAPGRGRVERTAAGPGRRRRRVAAIAAAGGERRRQPRRRATAAPSGGCGSRRRPHSTGRCGRAGCGPASRSSTTGFATSAPATRARRRSSRR